MKWLTNLLILVILLAIGYSVFQEKVDPYLPEQARQMLHRLNLPKLGTPSEIAVKQSSPADSGAGDLNIKKTFETLKEIKASGEKNKNTLDEVLN